jgi:hypothetical protein
MSALCQHQTLPDIIRSLVSGTNSVAQAMLFSARPLPRDIAFCGASAKSDQ